MATFLPATDFSTRQPYPDARRVIVKPFLPGEEVMASGTREFRNEDEAAASPLAGALFDLGDVTGVFFGRNFISVTAAPGVDWSALKPQVVAMLLDHFVTGAPLFHPASAANPQQKTFADQLNDEDDAPAKPAR